jgi:cytochrome c oxidase subunit 5a
MVTEGHLDAGWCFWNIGMKAKVVNKGQYDQYLEDLEPLRKELGVSLEEDLYPETAE